VRIPKKKIIPNSATGTLDRKGNAPKTHTKHNKLGRECTYDIGVVGDQCRRG